VTCAINLGSVHALQNPVAFFVDVRFFIGGTASVPSTNQLGYAGGDARVAFTMISAIVPAAGLSSRMGQNKLLMPFGDKSLIEHAVDTLRASDIDEIVVVLGHEAGQVRSRLGRHEGHRVNFVHNPDYREGLSTSVRAGMGAVAKGTEAIMIYLADQPLIEPDEINHLIQAFAHAKRAGKSIVIPFFENQRGNPVILDASYRAMALDIAGDVGCRRIIKRHPEQVFAVQMQTDHVVRDVDTPEDFLGVR
jgi:molybdenum cofactor cytidylyltransferase